MTHAAPEIPSVYTSPSYYQLMHGERVSDLPFYLELAAADANLDVLECGIGVGRVAIPLARRGCRVTGIDTSAAMLEQLQQAVAAEDEEVRGRLSWQQADVRSLQLGERFDLVTCPFNGIAHHHTAEQQAAFFASVRQHLKPAGLFAFDATIPNPELLAGSRSDIPWFRHPDDGAVCRWSETSDYDALTQVLQLDASIRFMEDERPEQRLRLRLRQLFPQETLLLLHQHGFEVVERRDLGDVLAYVCRIFVDTRQRVG